MASEARSNDHNAEKRGEGKLPTDILKISGADEESKGSNEGEETERWKFAAKEAK